MLQSLAVLIVSELRMMMRAKTTLFWIFLFPFFFLSMMMMSYGTSGTLASVSLDVDDQDGSALSARYLDVVRSSFANQDGLHFEMHRVAANVQTAAAGTVLLQIPAGFAATIERGDPMQLHVLQRGDSLNNRLAVRILRSVTVKFNADIANTPMMVTLDVAASAPQPSIKFSQYMLTGILVMSVMASAMSNTCVALAERRERNVFKLMACLPINHGHYLFAMLMSRIVMLAFASVLLLFSAHWVFGIPLQLTTSRLVGTAVVIGVGATTLLAMGIALSVRLASVPDAVFVSNFAYISLLFLSDLTMPMSSMSPTLRHMASFLPTAEFGTALRHVLVGGEGLVAQGQPLCVMLAWTLLFAAVARVFFRWHRQ